MERCGRWGVISIKFKGLDRMVDDLRRARKKAIPYAIRDTLNGAAFEARKVWQGEIRREFTLRNKFTERSVLVERVRGLDPKRMEARVGSVASYARQIEEGATRRARGKFRAIPTASARVGGSPAKLVRSAAKLRGIQAARARKGSSPKQRNAIALSIARKNKQRHALLERSKGGKALFEVRKRLAPKMLWDVSRRSVRVNARPTLGPALKRLSSAKLESIARDALLRQLRRHGVPAY